MIVWGILVIIVIVIIGLLFMRIKHFGKRIKLVLLAAILIFLIVSANSTIQGRNIKLDSFGGYMDAVASYLGWLVNFSKDSVKFTGNAIKTIRANLGK